jgi:hypothetical protein
VGALFVVCKPSGSTIRTEKILILEDFNFKNQQQEENLHEERKRPKRF